MFSEEAVGLHLAFLLKTSLILPLLPSTEKESHSQNSDQLPAYKHVNTCMCIIIRNQRWMEWHLFIFMELLAIIAGFSLNGINFLRSIGQVTK